MRTDIGQQLGPSAKLALGVVGEVGNLKISIRGNEKSELTFRETAGLTPAYRRRSCAVPRVQDLPFIFFHAIALNKGVCGNIQTDRERLGIGNLECNFRQLVLLTAHDFRSIEKLSVQLHLNVIVGVNITDDPADA